MKNYDAPTALNRRRFGVLAAGTIAGSVTKKVALGAPPASSGKPAAPPASFGKPAAPPASSGTTANPDASPYDPVLGEQPNVTRWRHGMVLRTGSTVSNVVATLPIPRPWPEQTVRRVDQDVDRVWRTAVRTALNDLADQWVLSARSIRSGTHQAFVIFEITRHDLLPPRQTDGLQIPKRLPRDMRMFLGTSPQIDTTHGLIKRLASELRPQDGQSAWQTVETIYDTVRSKVQYVEGPIRSASAALKDGFGDCEDMTSLFVALCRNLRIPARMVWIPGHCYPEFCLYDPDGEPHWYPCQAAGTRQFGEMRERRPVIQKGDQFRVPESKAPVRYLAETFTCQVRGKSNPSPSFVMAEVNLVE